MKKIFLLTQNMNEEERAQIFERLEFYLDDRELYDVHEKHLLSPDLMLSKKPVLVFGVREGFFYKKLLKKKNVFDIDYRHNPGDGWAWHNLLVNLTKDRANIGEVRERFHEYLSKIWKNDYKKVYIFGTGPSLEKAIDRKWSDGYRIVCNTIVRDIELWNWIEPHFIIAGDAIHHYGHNELAKAFRSDLKKRLTETNTMFVYPIMFDPLVQKEFEDHRDRLIPVPMGTHNKVHTDLTKYFQFPGHGNILNLMLLPLGCTLAKDIYLWGFDGRAPDAKLLWKSSGKHSYPEYLNDLHMAHPAFINHIMPKDQPDKYVEDVLGDSFEQALSQAEKEGWKFTMMHRSWTDTLSRRYDANAEIKTPS